MKSLQCVAILFVLVGAAPRAHADEKTAAARTHAGEANKFYNLGDFANAISEYKAAYSALPDPAFLYNIAQAYRISNNSQQALFFYRSFLRASPDAANRDEVQDRIHKLEEQIKAQESLSNSPPTSTIPLQAPTAAPAASVETTRAPSATELTKAPPPPRERPIYKKWWFWTGVSAIAVGAAVGVGLGIGLSQPQPPSSHFGNTGVF